LAQIIGSLIGQGLRQNLERKFLVEQEADESLYWLELLKDSGIAKGALLAELLVEADELVAIFTTIGKKSK